MKVAAFLPNTIQEYEGEISALVFLPGCNVRCSFCHNVQLATADTQSGTKPLKKILQDPLITAITISGGEPTIHHNLIQNLRNIRQTTSLKIKLFTNGLRPEVIKKICEEHLIDAISVDLKGTKNLSQILGVKISDQTYLNTIADSIIFAHANDIKTEVRSTLHPQFDLKTAETFMSIVLPEITYITQRYIKAGEQDLWPQSTNTNAPTRTAKK